tara:strand:+ start:197 stop:379 length:183 start_codon:yes stop_codon:yes gene_type:complete
MNNSNDEIQSSLEIGADKNGLDQLDFDKIEEKLEVLCVHCKRTLENGIRCMGICVADSDY